MDILISAYGVGLFSGNIWLPLNFYNSGGFNSFHITGGGTTIQVQDDNAYKTSVIYIILEYTKK